MGVIPYMEIGGIGMGFIGNRKMKKERRWGKGIISCGKGRTCIEGKGGRQKMNWGRKECRRV